MKTISCILILLLLLTGLPEAVTAQKAVGIFNKQSVKQMFLADSVQMEFEVIRINNIHIKAVRDFLKTYTNANNVKWYPVEDGFIATFEEGGVETRVQYDVAGRRKEVLRTYDESHMNADLKDLVKQQYYDYDILVAYEIEHADRIFTVVKIMDKTNIKVLQVSENKMEVLEDYVNGNG